mmetsp:Transcript_3272/g.7245  ORF Transcript_3272/g.7245 Transcript_3272/m.7245 type:complete len:541 (-) Transcript_3272:84-1706(-)|eukprot:CAMPEP_0172323702 /NCGR_PEP_ID=MMETSP1058-20130122/49435_1 /TAXON_ID=83371 /ORGANISM="Detonula confervacea, Strain CCMP 353" /LENGTH=540 /DNA_ID=CAMNT_0013039779 /DNA_START=1489 /DNA_END=3111 /DNA_ORIENTATION=+
MPCDFPPIKNEAEDEADPHGVFAVDIPLADVAVAEEEETALLAAQQDDVLENSIPLDELIPPPMEEEPVPAPLEEPPMEDHMEEPDVHIALDETAVLLAAQEDVVENPPPMEEPTGFVTDPLALHVDHHMDPEQAALDAGEEAAAAAMEAAAAAEAAEAAIGNVLDDVGVDVHAVQAQHAAALLEADHEYALPVADVGVDHASLELQQHAAAVAAAEADHAYAKAAAEADHEYALAAAAAAAAVQAADGMAVVVDQALLATAAAAAASQVAEEFAEQSADMTHGAGLPQDMSGYGPPLLDAHSQEMFDPDSPSRLEMGDHGDLLEARRQKDRKRYSAMTPEARAAYNAHRRELYHKQGENARKRRRERERERYHSLEGESKKSRNERRAKLERDRYNRLSKDELSDRNSKRRDRAKARKVHTKDGPEDAAAPLAEEGVVLTIPPPVEIKTEVVINDGVPNLPNMGMQDADVLGAPLPEATVDVTDAAMADASALAAEVAEQVIAGTNLESAMEAAVAVGASAALDHMHAVAEEEGPTVQI